MKKKQGHKFERQHPLDHVEFVLLTANMLNNIYGQLLQCGFLSRISFFYLIIQLYTMTKTLGNISFLFYSNKEDSVALFGMAALY